MPQKVPGFVVYGLREIYHELGTYEFKVVLDQRLYKNSHGCGAVLADSDRRPRELVVEHWGRKMRMEFIVDQTVPDGVSTVELSLSGSSGLSKHYLHFWVIKP